MRPASAAPDRLIARLPHSNRYIVTLDGIRIPTFCNKLYPGLLIPRPQQTSHKLSPSCVRHCPQSIDASVNAYIAGC